MIASLKKMLPVVVLFSSMEAGAVCDQSEYNRQWETLRSIWSDTYQNNCIHADSFLARFGQPIGGLSSCRIDSRNEATRAFARWVKNACVSACENAGVAMGSQFGLEVASQVCNVYASPSQGVLCEERVAETCVQSLTDTVARACPRAIGGVEFQNAVQDCYNWAN
jgi:hypothetical protein